MKKVVKKKLIKKVAKKATKKLAPKKKAMKKLVKKQVKKAPKQSTKKFVAKAPSMGTRVGVVTHYYGGLGVAIVKCEKPIAEGVQLHFKGATTDFMDTVTSMQYDHQVIMLAAKGQEVGIKVRDKTREGDEVYLVEKISS